MLGRCEPKSKGVVMTQKSHQMLEVNDADWESKVAGSELPVLVDFWAPWCGPCLAMAPTLEAVAKEYDGKVLIAKMNVDENKNIPYEFNVRSIPFLVLFRRGEIVDSLVGAVPKAKLTGMLDKALS